MKCVCISMLVYACLGTDHDVLISSGIEVESDAREKEMMTHIMSHGEVEKAHKEAKQIDEKYLQERIKSCRQHLLKN